MKNSNQTAFKLIGLISIVFIFATFITPTYALANDDSNSNSFSPGDINEDGKLNILDFILLKLLLLGQETPSDNADVDGNGIINTIDLDTLLDQFFGGTSTPHGGGGGGGGGSTIPKTSPNTIYCDNLSAKTRGIPFTLKVMAMNITPNVSTGQFDLKYDPNILSVTGVTSGSIGSTPVPIPPTSWNVITTGVSGGKYILRVIINQDTPASGYGYFCQITFNGTTVGTSSLEFVEGEGNPSGWLILNDGVFPPNELNVTWSNGSVTIQ